MLTLRCFLLFDAGFRKKKKIVAKAKELAAKEDAAEAATKKAAEKEKAAKAAGKLTQAFPRL